MNFDPKQTHVLHEWKHGKPLIACQFDPKGRYVFSSSEDFTLQRWKWDSGEKVAWEAHDSWVHDLALLPDGETLISAGCDDRIILWTATAEIPKPIKEIKAHAGWVRCLDVSPDGSQFASGGNDKLVKLWTAKGDAVREFAGHDSHVYSVLFHPDGKFLLSGDLSGKVHQWEIATGKLVRTFDTPDLHTYNTGQQVHYGGVRGLAISRDKKFLACCGLHKATNPLGAISEPLVVLFDWAEGKIVQSQPAAGNKGIGWRVEFLQDDVEVCGTGGTSGTFLFFWKTGETKPFHQFKMNDTARHMAIHPDGLHAALTQHNGILRICRMAKKEA